MDRVKKIFVQKKTFMIFAIIIGLIVFSITSYRVFTTGITYDESFTYMNYVFDNPFKVFTLLWSDTVWANNHILNSFLISLVQLITGTSFNIPVIRISGLLFYILYLVMAYNICKDYKGRYAYFLLFALDYGINEYFGLARGYGMCAALVTTGLYFYQNYLKNNKFKSLNLSFLFMLLSCYANTVALLIFASIVFLTFIKLLKQKELLQYIKKCFLIIIPIAILTLIIIKYHFNISSEGLPLYGATTGFIEDVIVSMLVTHGFNGATKLAVYIIISILLSITIVNIKAILKNNIVQLVIIYFIIYVLAIKISDNMWITGRCLIPTIPLVILGIIQFIETFIKEKRTYMIMNLSIILISISTFTTNLNLTHTRDFYDNYIIEEKAFEALDKEDQSIIEPYRENYTSYYYQQKIIKEYGKDIFDFNQIEMK